MRRMGSIVLVMAVVFTVLSCKMADRSPEPGVLAHRESAAGQVAAEATESVAGEEAQQASLAGVQDTVRKIIYDAEVTVKVEDHQEASAELEAWVEKAGGYVSARDLQKRTGDAVTLMVTVRVPAESFGGAMERIARLGYVTGEQTRSDDVTEDYYDVQARLDNARKGEKQLQSIMEEKAGTLEEYLAVQRELSDVREKIERLEGKLRVWDDLVDFSTITVVMQEDAEYAPPPPPTFASRISDGFSGSVKALWTFLQGLVVVAVVLAPWLGLLLVLFSPLVILLVVLHRRAKKRRARAQ